MQLAVCANDPMTGYHKRHWIGGIGPANRARCVRMANFLGNLRISASLTIWNSIHCLHGLSLEWAQGQPINIKGKLSELCGDCQENWPCERSEEHTSELQSLTNIV